MRVVLLCCILIPFLVFSSQEYIKLSARVENKHSEEVCKRFNLEPYAGGGGMMFDVELVIQSFVSHQPSNLAQARRLFVYCAQDLLDRMNGDTAIRPYLRQYPFKIENLKYAIHFKDKRSNRMPYPLISTVHSQGIHSDRSNFIFYEVEDGSFLGKTIHGETYEEALRIVQEEDAQAALQVKQTVQKGERKVLPRRQDRMNRFMR